MSVIQGCSSAGKRNVCPSPKRKSGAVKGVVWAGVGGWVRGKVRIQSPVYPLYVSMCGTVKTDTVHRQPERSNFLPQYEDQRREN